MHVQRHYMGFGPKFVTLVKETIRFSSARVWKPSTLKCDRPYEKGAYGEKYEIAVLTRN